MAGKKAGKSSEKAIVKPHGWPEEEIPNDLVAHVAHQYREASISLFRGVDTLVLPLYTLGGLAIELYLKALNAKWVFEQESIDPAAEPLGLAVTSVPLKFGHDLLPLFNALQATIRTELDTAYKKDPMVEDAPSIRDALAKYEGTFEKSRYSFEHTEPLPRVSRA
jgi:hypothetical protein